MRFMDEADVVGHSMHTFPVDRMWCVTNDSGRHSNLSQRFAFLSANDLVAVRTELDGRYASVGLRCNRPVTKRAVHPKALNLIARRISVDRGPGVNCVWKSDRLFDPLVETQNRYRLTEPSCDDERQHRAAHGYYAKRSDSENWDQHLEPQRSGPVFLAQKLKQCCQDVSTPGLLSNPS